MEEVEKSIEVNAPVSAVFERWTRIEDYPQFMKSLREVSRINEIHFHWKGQQHACEYESLVEIMLQIPARRLAWRSISGPESSGAVSFEPHANDKTQITYKMRFVPDAGWHDPAAVAQRVEENLRNFKALIES